MADEGNGGMHIPPSGDRFSCCTRCLSLSYQYISEGPETPPARTYHPMPVPDDLANLYLEMESCKQKARPEKARKSKTRSTNNLDVEKGEIDYALDQLLQRETATDWAKQENVGCSVSLPALARMRWLDRCCTCINLQKINLQKAH